MAKLSSGAQGAAQLIWTPAASGWDRPGLTLAGDGDELESEGGQIDRGRAERPVGTAPEFERSSLPPSPATGRPGQRGHVDGGPWHNGKPDAGLRGVAGAIPGAPKVAVQV